MMEKKVTFGVTSKGKPMVIHKQYEFVKHQKYASGNFQWRCKLFVPKRYESLKLRVANAVARYSRSEILVYLRGIAYLSHK